MTIAPYAASAETRVHRPFCLSGKSDAVQAASPKGLRFAAIDTLPIGRAGNPTLMLPDMSDDSDTSIEKVRRAAALADSFDLLRPGSPGQDLHGLGPLSKDGEFIVRALRPLRVLLERETADRRTLQAQSDDLRARLAAAQLETAEARRDADVQRAVAASAQAHVKDLRAQVVALRDALAEPPPRPWWWPF
jgi:hypothetical protein